jgi:DNA-binding transcriptional MerR regulator
LTVQFRNLWHFYRIFTKYFGYNVTKPVQKSGFRSGVAARLAGIPVETLRVWERRYGISGRSSTPGSQRLYDKTDIQRLAMLKRLVDLGQSIGTIAHLDIAALQATQDALVSLASSGSNGQNAANPRVALIGPILGADITEAVIEGLAIDVIARFASFGLFKESIDNNPLDAMLIEVPTLLDNIAEEIGNFAIEHQIGKVILFYRFAPNTLIRKLRALGHAVVRMPSDMQEVSMLCKAILSRQGPEPGRSTSLHTDSVDIQPPKFSVDTLLRLTQMKSSVYCECPSQLADLLISVSAFERYSAQCANQSPEDAVLHQRLEQDAARVRTILEGAITEVIRHENISL